MPLTCELSRLETTFGPEPIAPRVKSDLRLAPVLVLFVNRCDQVPVVGREPKHAARCQPR